MNVLAKDALNLPGFKNPQCSHHENLVSKQTKYLKLQKPNTYLEHKTHIGRGKLGNGERLSFEAYKYKENIIYVTIIMFHKEHINFYPETHFYRYNCCRFEVMVHKRRWRRSAITCIAGGKCERIYMCNGCVRLPNFDLLIISLFMERILFVSY